MTAGTNVASLLARPVGDANLLNSSLKNVRYGCGTITDFWSDPYSQRRCLFCVRLPLSSFQIAQTKLQAIGQVTGSAEWTESVRYRVSVLAGCRLMDWQGETESRQGAEETEQAKKAAYDAATSKNNSGKLKSGIGMVIGDQEMQKGSHAST